LPLLLDPIERIVYRLGRVDATSGYANNSI